MLAIELCVLLLHHLMVYILLVCDTQIFAQTAFVRFLAVKLASRPELSCVNSPTSAIEGDS